MNFARYLRHLIYRNPPSNFCSTEKYFTNKIVKSPPKKEKKKVQTLIKKTKQKKTHTEKNLSTTYIKSYILLLFKTVFIHPFAASHNTFKARGFRNNESQDLPTSENYFSPLLI